MKLILILVAIFLCKCTYAARGGGKGKGKGIKGLFPFPNLRMKSLLNDKKQHPNAANITFSSHWYQPYRLGYKILLVCEASGKPVPAIHWYKDGSEMAMEPNRFLYMRIINNTTSYSKIEIDPAVVGDQGVFSCLANNRNGGEVKNFKTEYV